MRDPIAQTMKIILRHGGVVLLAGLAVLITGCRKQKQPTVNPQAQAPTISAPAQPSSAAQPSQPVTTAPAPPAPASTTTTPAQTAVKKKSKPKKKHRHRTEVAKKTNGEKTNGAQTSPATPVATAHPPIQPAPPPVSTAAVNAKPAAPDANGDASVAISAAMDNSDETREREMTEQLLTSTDANLKSITRTLTADERAMVDTIRNYMAQSRAATTNGDLVRANNLAVKAHLLSDELVKR